MTTTRRTAFKTLLGSAFAGSVAGSLASPAVAQDVATCEPRPEPVWGQGVEGQRKADLGNGTFLNPIISGDRPDPTVLKDGDDYYMTFSSMLSYPGIIIWHSRDLVNWTPIGPALTKPIGSVWAMDIIKHNGRYYIYIPSNPEGRPCIFVIWADNIRGPWSEPVEIEGTTGFIDPGHAVGEDGKRYLFVNGIRKAPLSDDGLRLEGPLEMAYEPWHYPKDWVVEMFAPEGPKIFKRGEYFYLVTAVGGTSGPPTSHMVIAARSKSIHGPWEHSPYNPLVRTVSENEPWWSRGHATVIQGPLDDSDWWMIYHGYENGFRTLGRQCLLEPVEWTEDGWFVAKGGDLSKPMAKPEGGQAGPAGFAFSGDITPEKLGVQWTFHNPGPDEMSRLTFDKGAAVLSGKGTSPSDTSPLVFLHGDRRYEAEATFEIPADGEAGLLLYYDERMSVGIGFTSDQMRTFNHGSEQGWMREAKNVSKVSIRVRNDRNVVTWSYSLDGQNWTQHPWQMEVSGIHHNVFGNFLSLRLALFSCGKAPVRISDFRYRGLDTQA